MVIGFVVPNRPEAPREVRRKVRAQLEDALEARLIENLELLLTEVVTNAVKYSGSGPGSAIQVRIELDEEIVSVSIRDQGPGFDPGAPTRPVAQTGGGGFGLFLLDQISTRWGVERQGDAFRVWFRLRR